ncbi:MAG: metalloregulator ArsR/SmtB family transcription factor [Actinomycetaceae bacterium]|nr:metalloregulator ArsR/SmtB family transcription factor [Actinomycetaceae bacterium]
MPNLSASETHIRAVSQLGHALSEDIRTKILLELRLGSSYPSDLADHLDVSRQVMSNQLGWLKSHGLVVATRQGQRVSYQLASPHIAHALDEMLKVTLSIDPQCCSNDDCNCEPGSCPCCIGSGEHCYDEH